MGEIINFVEARERLKMAGLVSALKAKQEQENNPQARPVFISALPGVSIPAEYTDFRPFLQRDGLILLGWAFWDNSPAFKTGYKVHWITSTPKYRRYSSSIVSMKEPINKITPTMLGNPFFADGLWGNRYYSYSDKILAKYVVLCAPPDLNSRNIPAFIQLLKGSGITVDFDFKYSLGGQKALEFKRQQEEISGRINQIKGAEA